MKEREDRRKETFRKNWKKRMAGCSLLALCLSISSGLSGCGLSSGTGAVSGTLAQPGQELQETPKEEKDLEFSRRFYLTSPDHLQLVTAEELEDWETSGTEKKELEEGKTSWGIVLAEFPREQVTMYGYLDPERLFQGVMIQCGDSVSYFPELVYMSDSHQMPDAVSDGSGSMFTVSFHAETGKDRKRDSLWVFLRSESGTMTADCFEEEDYLSQMANRFSLSFQKGEPEGTLLRQDGQALGKADLSWAKDAEITGLNISDRVCFEPGNPARLETEIGISAEGRKPYYGDDLAVTAPIEIVVRTYEDGSRGAEFLIGEVEPLTEEGLAEEREETGKIKDEAGEIKEEAEKGAGKTEEQGHSE